MTTDTQTVIESALHLPSQIRAFLADKLLESLDVENDEELSPAWRDEIIKRCKEIDDGVVTLIPAERVFQEISQVTG
jgi:putative addiction module component (TIGR02574 family)